MLAQSDTTNTCTRTFNGHVYEGQSQKPLLGAVIYFPELKKGAETNEKGEFKIIALCEGQYLFKVSYLGYKTLQQTIDIDKSAHRDIMLQADTNLLESIVVTGEKQDVYLQTLPINTLEAKALDRTRGLNLAESLKEIPGMFTFQTGPNISKPVLHGMHSNRLLIMNAGLRLEAQQWGAEHAPEIDPFVSNKLTVVKGASGLRYGSDAISGVIIVEPKSHKDISGIGGELNLGGFSNNKMGVGALMLEGNITKIPDLKWRAQGSYKHAGSAQTPRYLLSNTAYREDNFSASMGYLKKKFSIEAYFSRFHTTLGILPDAQPNNNKDLAIAIQRTQPRTIEPFTYQINRGFQDVTHHLFSVKSQLNISDIGTLNLILGSQWNHRQEYDRHKPLVDSLKESPQYDFRLSTQSTELVFDHKQGHHLQGLFGLSYQQQVNEWDGTRFLIPTYLSNSYGAFILEKWQLNRLELEAGVRYDVKNYTYLFRKGIQFSDSSYTYQNFSGNMGASFRLSPQFTLKSNIGATFRPPTPNEMFVNGQVHGSVFIEVGNANLQPEQGYKFITSATYQSNKFSFEATAHYAYINNYIYLKPTLLYRETRVGQLLEFAYTQTNASFYGMDLNADYQLSKAVNVIAKGSAVNGFNETFQDFMVFIPPYRGEVAARWQPQFATFLKNNAVYGQITGSFTATQTRVNPNSDFVPPPQGYALAALELGADVAIGKQLININFQINNIFNTSYREYMNRYRYFADEPGRNFIVRVKIPLFIYQPKV